MKETENQAHKVATVTVDEVIGKLKDCLKKRELTFQKSFLSCNKQPNGKISKNDFRKVLEDHEMYMDDYQFNLLTEKLGFTNEGLTFFDFLAFFEDSQESGQGIILYPHYRVNNTKFHQMTAEECYCYLMETLKGFKDAYFLFHKMDSNSDGFVTMHDLKRFMESCKFIFTKREFLRMLEMFGLQMNSTLNYMEFVDLLHMEGPREIRPWMNSSYRPRQAKESTELASEQAHYYLAIKARNRWHDLARTFREFDSDGNGIIMKKDLQTVLYRFAVPITSAEFDKLWARYDRDKKGYITQQEFLQRLGIEHVHGDRVPGRHDVEDTCAGLQEPHIQMQTTEEQQTKAQDTEKTKQQIIDKFKDYFQDFSKSFAKMDKNRDGFITVEELHKMLLHYNYHFDKKQFISLLFRLGIKVDDGKLPYFDFLRVIDDGKTSKFGERKEDILIQNCQMLSPEKALIKLKEAVTCSYDLLCKAFTEFDKESTGTIMPLEFRHILDNFCAKLTDNQFGYLLTKVKVNDDTSVDWKAFLNNFSFYDTETATDWVKKVQKVTQLKSKPELSMRDIMARIQEVVVARFHILAEEFISTDYAKIGATTKNDFREMCNKHFMLLTDDQFENLWNTMPINDFGNLKYLEFLKKFSLDAQDSAAVYSRRSFYKSASPVLKPSSRPTSSKPRRPKTAPSVLNRSSSREPRQRPRTAVPGSTSLLNYEVIENKLKKSVHKIWQHILKACRRKDLEKQGEITAAEFIAVMEKLCCDISKEELDLLIVKYDIKNNGMFSYHDFLQNVVFTPKAQENLLLQRMKVHKPRVPMSTGIGSSIFFDAMVRIHPKILRCWRSIRRSFQSCDENGAGYIKVQDFRQILQQHSVNLSEEEFFHIMGFYDRDLSSKISYNDFLRVFLN